MLSHEYAWAGAVNGLNASVPYAGLDHLYGATAEKSSRRGARARGAARLRDWSLRFNGAQRRLGECRDGQLLILLSRSHAAIDPPERIADTILHEIAHALAGPGAGDTVWFFARGGPYTGTIVRMNPKRARIQCGEIPWSVDYTRLDASLGPDAERSWN